LKQLSDSFYFPADVDVKIADDLPTIETDPTLLKQIFANLLRNAVLFNQSEHKLVEIGSSPAGDHYYELFCRDNGIGIDPAHHAQVFNAFQRLWSREEYKGSGLGLAIVKKAITKLGGSVRLESQPGKGTTFYLLLPRPEKQR
jgi:signal transduction histidine kinase